MASLAAPSDFRSLSRQPPPDPDVHATLSDFLTYTEHFPSHLTRALTLIGDQRQRAEEKISNVHHDTSLYSKRPTLEHKPDPVEMRKQISYALEEAEKACRMAVEEAVRLDETCQREAKRLDMITEKLKAQPLPPSRDPTPEQQALTSPNLKKERTMPTRADETTEEKPRRHLTDKAATKLRGRKIMVPGEVLPPPDPNALPESISDWTSPRVSPPLEQPPLTAQGTPRPRSRTPKQPKTDKQRKEKPPKPRAPRAPGLPGTNSHSAVAGISTSNALLALTPPPDDAIKGSKWLPWIKLTEWEMAKLRKRMKKNAIWVPSQTMVRRELKNLGRGVAGKEAARMAAETSGEIFLDEGNEPDPTKVVVTGEDTAQMNDMLGPQMYAEDDDADAELINRGMRLNEAKKLKRQRLLEEQALQAQLAREQGLEAPSEPKALAAAPAPESSKKRKRGGTPHANPPLPSITETPDPLSKPGPAPKKLKIATTSANNAPAANGTSKVPLAPAGASSSPRLASTRNQQRASTPPAATGSRKPTLVLKASKAVSEEPPNRRASLRRGSNASLPNSGSLMSPTAANASQQTSTKPARRSKRPAPGILARDREDGDAKVGVSKRKAAPRKRGATTSNSRAASANANNSQQQHQQQQQQPSSASLEAPDEYVDPDEPRYCICSDVSWGTMIACDNDDCEKEWFHLSCVGLSDLPPRRTKWYCPDCRKKLKVGMGSNGLVGRQQGR
ncbi:hypothetical protein KC355_g7701 [Hortaea werneckii]|nr:hypothetical protein KC355_g7701 [Hortaea werneckii]